MGRSSSISKLHAIAWLACAVLLLIGLAASASASTRLSGDYLKGTATTAAVDPQLVDELHERGTATMLVYLREQADLSPAFKMSWEERGWYVYEQLTAVAERSQARLRGQLQSRGVNHRAFWIDNLIIVRQADISLLDELRTSPEVRAILAEPEIILIEPEDTAVQEAAGGPRAPESNLVHVGATEVWAMGYTGEGLVVGSIDTGVHYTHESLVNQYRGNQGGGSFDHNYNWWNPHTTPVAPFDFNGHGSHTTGTMVGDNGADRQTGMAPGAKWIACAGFDTDGSGPFTAMVECGEFMAAPTDLAGNNPDPDRRAHVVNNSWGNCQQQYNDFFEGVIDAWIAAGIVPVTSNGNNSNCGYNAPPGLNTVGNPARSGKVLGIGSTGTNDGQYAPHSNWGPTDDPNPGLPDYPDPMGHPSLKPNVVAPGVSILSAYVLDDTNDTYAWSTGTSMAGPHVAGLIPLMWQAAPCLLGDYATTGTIIQQTARPVPYPSGGHPPSGPGNHPNYATGWGEIDAVNAVAEAKIRCGEHGRLVGTVTSAATGAPIQDVDIVIDNPLGPPAQFAVRTDADGHYQRIVAALAEPNGSYTVTFSKAGGFGTAEVSLVEVGDGEEVELNIALDAGFLELPEDIYVTMPHGEVAEFEVDLSNAGTLETPVELELLRGVREDFESAFSPGEWQVINHGGDCVWARNDEVTPHDDEPVDPQHGGRPNFAGGEGFSAIADADACGPGTTMDTSLISPPVDLRATDETVLSFLVSYYHLGGSGFSVSSSVDGGDTWQPHIDWTFDVHPFGPGLPRTVDLSQHLGAEDVRVRFHYTAQWDWWAQIDQVRLTADLPWAVLTPLSLDIPAGDSMAATLEIDSGPLPGPGLYTINLLVEHTTPEQASPIVIPVTVEVTAGKTPELEVMPTELAFGQVDVNGSAGAQTVTLSSTGGAPVEITGLGTPEPPFARTGGDCPDTPFSLAPAETCTLEYDFAPTAEGLFETVVEITANTDPAVATITLSGQGIEDVPPTDEIFEDRFEGDTD